MKRCLFPIAFIVFGFFCIPYAWSAPIISSISGSLINNMSVVISGSGFGTKRYPAPVLWDTFESGNYGQKIYDSDATIGDWDVGVGSDRPEYSNVVKHSGSMASYHQFRPAEENISLCKNFDFSRLYMEFWIYVNYLELRSRNWKPWRFYGDSDTMQISYVWFCSDRTMTYFHYPCLEHADWAGAKIYSHGSWHHFQIEFAESSPDTANGHVKQWINGLLTNNYSGSTRCNSNHFNQIRIGHYWATDELEACRPNSGADVYIDNVYIDTSWARVEIGNSSTYAGSTKREIQIPSAWSDSSITISVNQGAFPSCEIVYIYVVDANGEMNTSGYPAKIVTGDQAPPCSPTGLRVVP